MAKQKITKQIAESMARKIRQELIAKREAIINDFYIITKDKVLIDSLSEKYVKAVDDMKKAKNELEKIVGRQMYIYNKTDQKSLSDLAKNAYIIERIGDVPSTDDVVDDIMIDSFGSDDAHDIIKRIIDNYASNFKRG